MAVQLVGANQPEVVAAVQILKQLAKRLLPSWVHRSSFKGASKASDRATETPGAWCGSLDMRKENPISLFQST